MKKLVLAVTLVALVAAAVFGGQAIASNKPAEVTVSEETSAIWGGSYWGSPVRIQTDENWITVSDDDVTTNIDYRQIRHVSLTLMVTGIEASDTVSIYLEMPSGQLGDIGYITADGLYTYEFDSDNFSIHTHDAGGILINVSYYITTTYPRY
jgi:hypothetical protein